MTFASNIQNFLHPNFQFTHFKTSYSSIKKLGIMYAKLSTSITSDLHIQNYQTIYSKKPYTSLSFKLHIKAFVLEIKNFQTIYTKLFTCLALTSHTKIFLHVVEKFLSQFLLCHIFETLNSILKYFKLCIKTFCIQHF